jgi:hypothetical protein
MPSSEGQNNAKKASRNGARAARQGSNDEAKAHQFKHFLVRLGSQLVNQQLAGVTIDGRTAAANAMSGDQRLKLRNLQGFKPFLEQAAAQLEGAHEASQ